MKKLLIVLFVLILITTPAFARYTRGYTRSNGAYVTGHNSSNSNGTVRDNYSYKANSNPYTGSTGSNYYRKSRSSEYYGS